MRSELRPTKQKTSRNLQIDASEQSEPKNCVYLDVGSGISFYNYLLEKRKPKI